ncbi:protein FLOURY 1-like [Aristolochia californica]|uniref:protein FLOURY 1-like n=1 Tax=Aristolochia californica TaxID=171875 RepID=UPI0035DC0BE7
MENVSNSNFLPRYEFFRWGICFRDIFGPVYHLFVLVVLFFLGLKVLDISWKDIAGSENGEKDELCAVCGKRETTVVEEEEEEEGKRLQEGSELKVKEELTASRKALRMVSYELEEERNAASSAAEAAILMILKLQNEKSLIQMEARQYRELAERKQCHDAQTIEYLKWVIQKYESNWKIEEADLEHLEEILFSGIWLAWEYGVK